MMKLLLMVTTVAALGVGAAYAQTYGTQTQPNQPSAAAPTTQKPAEPATSTQRATKTEQRTTTQDRTAVGGTRATAGQRQRPAPEVGGHTTPLQQPNTEGTPPAPTGEMALGTVRLNRRVKANGETLAPGAYQIRLTTQEAQPDAPGQTEALERWAEFRQGNQVRGREVVVIVPSNEISRVQKDSPPPSGGYKVENLVGGDYVRVWISRGGNHYLIYLPIG